MIIRGRALPLKTYRKRRSRAIHLLFKEFGRYVPLLLIGCPEEDLSTMRTPVAGAPRQDQWFDYFSGCHEPGAALLVDPNNKGRRDTLLLDPGDPARVIWEGPKLQPGSAARKAFGVHHSADVHDLKNHIFDAAKRAGGRIVMLSRDKEPGFQSAQFAIWKKKLRGVKVLNGEKVLTPMRMVKDADEIALHRQAIKITERGLKKTLPLIPKMKNESQIAAELLRHYVEPHFEPMAFSIIAGCGLQAATLHYPHDDQPLQRNRGVLIDSGATRGGYCADVTRCAPVSGTFSNKRYRDIYELVLHCNKRGRKHARPGITIKELNEIAWQPIIDAGFKRHHGLSHHIGMDVHDPSDYNIPLAPGMIISNEPGVYLADEEIGIRIEDDLLITRDGCEELTRAIPKTVSAIEQLMAR